jgi:hypothetical protein
MTCYPSNRDLCGQPPIQSTLHLSLPDRGFNFGLSPAKAQIVTNHEIGAVEISYLDNDSGEGRATRKVRLRVAPAHASVRHDVAHHRPAR